MQITDIRMRLVPNDEKLKAVASITFDDAFVVHDLKVIAGTDRPFVAMPSRKGRDGNYKDIAHPIKPELREEISARVLEEYEKALNSTEN